ncbi:uncharacterized protein LOC132699508 [Cylas formicarius]|uniref:uncharacterized protein LOC132699508 n=1 Tax=Cylas formicarius TaxID=197179 RepID=UPI002958BCCE|nr:uncharacterized protein LOC132699508 [Cylas formicarius]
MMSPIKYALLLFTKCLLICCWDLSSQGFDDYYYVSDIAIYFNKVFLALPRKTCFNGVKHPTVLEVSWTELSHPLSKTRIKAISGQTEGNCSELLNAVALDIETRRSKLWILDKGNEACSPKLIAYMLFQNSFSDLNIVLSGISGKMLNTIVIDDEIGIPTSRAFVGNTGENSIVVIYLDDMEWRKFALVEANKFLPINADFIAISKDKSLLYFTSTESTTMFSTNTTNFAEPISEVASANVTVLGHKLGVSSALETDYRNGLIYYLTRDYAVVRWSTGYPMMAEYHQVLAQSYKRMPFVSRIFTGPQRGIWALVNPFSPRECDFMNQSVALDSQSVTLKKRAIRIMRFNKFLDVFHNTETSLL